MSGTVTNVVHEQSPVMPGDNPTPTQVVDVLDDFVLDDAPAAPAAQTPPAQTATPATAAAPTHNAAPPAPSLDPAQFMSAVDRQIQESVRRSVAAPATATPAAPATPSAPVDPFAGIDLDLTPEDEALIGDVRVRRMMEKMASRAVRDYHTRAVAPALLEEQEFRRQTQAREAAMQDQFRRNGLASAVPDITELMRDPSYAPFAEEMISLPNIPQPVRRMDALGMAMQSGNFGWINEQFDTLRRARNTAREAQPNGGATAVVAPAASGGSPGQTLPPPGMEALSPRTYSRTKLEKELQRLAKDVQLNPRDHASLEKYNKLRAAYGRAAANGTLR